MSTPDEPAIGSVEPVRVAAVAPVPSVEPVPPAEPVPPPSAPAKEETHSPELRNRLQLTIVVILVLYTCAIAEAVVVP
ncbi:MAG: hypothetical protein ABW186_14160, partial [Rhodanobacteraceae bacterium]